MLLLLENKIHCGLIDGLAFRNKENNLHFPRLPETAAEVRHARPDA